MKLPTLKSTGIIENMVCYHLITLATFGNFHIKYTSQRNLSRTPYMNHISKINFIYTGDDVIKDKTSRSQVEEKKPAETQKDDRRQEPPNPHAPVDDKLQSREELNEEVNFSRTSILFSNIKGRVRGQLHLKVTLLKVLFHLL